MFHAVKGGVDVRTAAELFQRLAILLLVYFCADLARGSWQFEQVNSPGDYSGWTTQIATDSAGTPVILAQQTDGDTHIYKRLHNGVQQQSILPDGTFFSDIAVSADREVIGIARIGAPKLFGQDVGERQLELIESTPTGNWQTTIVELNLGINSGSVALAYGPGSEPMIAYVRSGYAKPRTCEAPGRWHVAKLHGRDWLILRGAKRRRSGRRSGWHAPRLLQRPQHYLRYAAFVVLTNRLAGGADQQFILGYERGQL